MTSARRALLAKVHMAKDGLAMAESSYRALLRRAGGADSAAGMGVPALERVVAEFERLGWRPRRAKSAHGAPAQRRRIAALLRGMELPDSYAEAIHRRMHGGAPPLAMASPAQLRAVTAALEKRRRRRRTA